MRIDKLGDISELQHLLKRIEIISSIPTVTSQNTDVSNNKIASTQSNVGKVAEFELLLTEIS